MVYMSSSENVLFTFSEEVYHSDEGEPRLRCDFFTTALSYGDRWVVQSI